jgi:hypothetical protein
MIWRFGILSDPGGIEQRRRGKRIARLCVDARQNCAGIGVADHLNFCGGDHGFASRLQCGKTR